MYNVNNLNNDSYIQTRQHQHHHHLHLQQQQQQQQQPQYYQPYAGIAAAAPPMNLANQTYHQASHANSVNDAYQPPSNVAQIGQSTLFWGNLVSVSSYPGQSLTLSFFF
jgi:hypothetical protein